VALFPIEFWLSLDESVRLRSEDLMLKSIDEGQYVVKSKKCVKGAAGTWARDLIHTSPMKRDYLVTLLRKLDSSDKTEQDYVLEYFYYTLLSEFNEMKDWAVTPKFVKLIEIKVKAGDRRFFNFAQTAISAYNGFWEESLKQSIDTFKEFEETSPDAYFGEIGRLFGMKPAGCSAKSATPC